MLLEHIAQYGYFGPPGHAIKHLVAFFPGFPVTQALVHVLVRQWTVSGLLVSPSRGLFVYTPYLVFAFWALARA